MIQRFDHLGRMLIVSALAAAFMALLATNPANAECGVLDSSLQDPGSHLVLNPGEEVTSCNGNLVLTFEGSNVVLKHIPSSQVIWQAPSNKGTAYAFYSPDTMGLDANLASTSASDSSDLASPSSLSSSGTETDVAVPSTPTSPETIANVPSTFNTGDPNLDANTAPLPASGSNTFSAGGVLDSPSQSSLFAASASASTPDNSVFNPDSSFLNPPAGSYFQKRSDLRKKYYSGALSTSRLLVQDNGNLVLSPDGGLTVQWASNTQGTDCTQAFFTDTVKETLASRAEKADSQAASLIREAPCGLLNVEVEQSDPQEFEDPEYLPPSQELIASLDPTASQDPSALNRRVELKRRSIINEYKFALGFTPKTGTTKLLVGSARLKKTWFYDGKVVSNAAGADPDRASIDGDNALWAGFVGFQWQFAAGDSNYDGFFPYKHEGKGSTISSRRAKLLFENVLGQPVIAFRVLWQETLWVQGFADGKRTCRGGTHCGFAPGP